MDIDEHKDILLQTCSIEQLGQQQRKIWVMCPKVMYEVVRLEGVVVSRDSLCHNASLLACTAADIEGLCDDIPPALVLC